MYTLFNYLALDTCTHCGPIFFTRLPKTHASILGRFQRLYGLSGANIKRWYDIIFINTKLWEGSRFDNSSLTLCGCNPVLGSFTERCSVKEPAFNGTRERSQESSFGKGLINITLTMYCSFLRRTWWATTFRPHCFTLLTACLRTIKWFWVGRGRGSSC